MHKRYANIEIRTEPILTGLLRNNKYYGQVLEQSTSIKSYQFSNYQKKLKGSIEGKEQLPAMMPLYLQQHLSSHYVSFDSDFESGNLDFVVQRSPSVFDLFLKIYSNTRGHSQWYFFSLVLKAFDGLMSKSIKVNIMNLTKTNSLYKHGMKPFSYDCRTGEWRQEIFMDVSQKQVTQYYFEERYGQPLQINKKYNVLSFSLNLYPDRKIFLAYCEPYSYSMLLDDL